MNNLRADLALRISKKEKIKLLKSEIKEVRLLLDDDMVKHFFSIYDVPLNQLEGISNQFDQVKDFYKSYPLSFSEDPFLDAFFRKLISEDSEITVAEFLQFREIVNSDPESTDFTKNYFDIILNSKTDEEVNKAMGHLMLSIYYEREYFYFLKHELNELKQKNRPANTPDQKSTITWTGSKIEFLQLATGLFESKKLKVEDKNRDRIYRSLAAMMGLVRLRQKLGTKPK